MSYVPLPEGRKIKGQLSFVALYYFEGVQTEWTMERGPNPISTLQQENALNPL